jgi:hypothetical protein
MRFGRDADTGILVQPYFLMRSYFVPKVLSGNPSIAARALIDLSVRPNSFEIALSEAPIRTLFLSTASSAGLQGFPLLDTIELHSRQNTRYFVDGRRSGLQYRVAQMAALGFVG